MKPERRLEYASSLKDMCRRYEQTKKWVEKMRAMHQHDQLEYKRGW